MAEFCDFFLIYLMQNSVTVDTPKSEIFSQKQLMAFKSESVYV